MRIRRLEIENFRAISELAVEGLNDAIVLAGPNGCGKSSVLDAIRLFKSAYGEYQPNEIQLWFGEFGINLHDDADAILSLLQERTRFARILLEIELSDAEKTWLRTSAQNIARANAWRMVAPETADWPDPLLADLYPRLRGKQEQVNRIVAPEVYAIRDQISQPSFIGELRIDPVTPERRFTVTQSSVLHSIFSTYQPQHIGIIDYHGPQRNFAREQLGGINLRSTSLDNQLRQFALYNSTNKYNSIKSELAVTYIRERIQREAGVEQASGSASITATLKELFATFFPGKEFVGAQPQPNGNLEFTVKTSTGAVHDINDLSSGEKEVLYGYLRLWNASPRNSIILLDEPELHLNPRLTQGLPQFYHNHIGKALGNQIWLVTHSDAILRQAVGHPDFQVFHMHPPTGYSENQAREIKAAEDVERAVMDLVGDLAAYRPGAKLVVVEGGGDSEFDSRMIATLFPEFYALVNLLSGGNKYRVRDLQTLLEQARTKGGITGRFYSITDRDFEKDDSTSPERVFKWDRYHIENYLLEEEYIAQVIRDLNLETPEINTTEKLAAALLASAKKTLSALVRIKLQDYANRVMLGCINTKIDPKAHAVSAALATVISASSRRLSEAAETHLRSDQLEEIERAYCEAFQQDLDSGDWKKTFRGRDILQRFVGDFLRGGIGYQPFRDLVLARMRDKGFQPSGMKGILDHILAD